MKKENEDESIFDCERVNMILKRNNEEVMMMKESEWIVNWDRVDWREDWK